MNKPRGERFLKVRTDAIRELGLVRATVLAAVVNRLPVSSYGLSIGAIASDCGLSWRQMHRHILSLETAGYLAIERDAGKVSSIQLGTSTRDKMSGVARFKPLTKCHTKKRERKIKEHSRDTSLCRQQRQMTNTVLTVLEEMETRVLWP